MLLQCMSAKTTTTTEDEAEGAVISLYIHNILNGTSEPVYYY